MIGKDLWLRILPFFGIGFLKPPIASYPECATLDPRTQALLSHPDVPAYELGFVCFSLFHLLYELQL